MSPDVHERASLIAQECLWVIKELVLVEFMWSREYENSRLARESFMKRRLESESESTGVRTLVAWCTQSTQATRVINSACSRALTTRTMLMTLEVGG